MQNEIFTDWNSFGPHREPSSDTLIVLCKKKYSLTMTVSFLIENHHQTVLLSYARRKYSLTGAVLVLIENHHQTVVMSYPRRNIYLMGQFRFSSRTIIRLSYYLMQKEIFSYWDSFGSHREPSSDCRIVLSEKKYSLNGTVSVLIENHHQTFLLPYAKRNILLLRQFRFSSRTIIRLSYCLIREEIFT